MFILLCVPTAVQLIPYSGAEVYDEESRDVDSSERLTNGNNAKGTHDKVYYGDQTVSQQNNNHQSNRKKELGNKRSHGELKIWNAKIDM